MKMVRRVVLGAIVVGLLAAMTSTPAVAELKGVNRAMISNLRDVTGILQSIVIYDFKSIASIAEKLGKRERFISKIQRLSAESRKYHGEVADDAAQIVTAANAKDKDGVVKSFSLLFATCHECHTKVRDKPRK